MSEVSEQPEKIRKTISFTHKQLGITTIAGLAIALAPYFEKTFVSRADGDKLVLQMQYLTEKVAIVDAKVEKIPDRIELLLKESSKQVSRDLDRNEKRIENLELYAYKTRRANSY